MENQQEHKKKDNSGIWVLLFFLLMLFGVLMMHKLAS